MDGSGDGRPGAPPGREIVPQWLQVATAYSWRLLIVSAALAVLAIALTRLQLVVLPVIAALFLCALLAPPAQWLERRGMPRVTATLITMVAGLATLSGVVALVGPPVIATADDLGDELTEAIDAVERWLVEGPLDLTEEDVRAAVDRAAEQLRDNVGSITQSAVTGAVIVAEIIVGALLTVVLLFFFLKDGRRMWDWVLGLLGDSRRDVDEMGQRAWTTLGGYLRGLTAVAAFDAVLIALALLVIGVPLVLPLAVITFFGAYVPIVGATVSGLLAVLVALVSLGLVEALLVLAAIIAIQQLEGNVLHPVIVGRSVDLHPVVILLAVTGGAVLYGIVGAFLAVPAVAVAAGCLSYAREREHGVGS